MLQILFIVVVVAAVSVIKNQDLCSVTIQQALCQFFFSLSFFYSILGFDLLGFWIC
jgi:hypothetical protein